MTTDDVIRRIIAFADTERLTRAELAQRAGVSRNTLVGMDRRDWSPSVATLRKLEALVPPEFQAGHHESP